MKMAPEDDQIIDTVVRAEAIRKSIEKDHAMRIDIMLIAELLMHQKVCELNVAGLKAIAESNGLIVEAVKDLCPLVNKLNDRK